MIIYNKECALAPCDGEMTYSLIAFSHILSGWWIAMGHELFAKVGKTRNPLPVDRKRADIEANQNQDQSARSRTCPAHVKQIGGLCSSGSIARRIW